MVTEDREIRLGFRCVTADAPQRQAFQSVLKYTGTGRAPEWEDIERGSVFSINNLMEDTQAKQTSSRRSAVYKQTFPLLRIGRGAETKA